MKLKLVVGKVVTRVRIKVAGMGRWGGSSRNSGELKCRRGTKRKKAGGNWVVMVGITVVKSWWWVRQLLER